MRKDWEHQKTEDILGTNGSDFGIELLSYSLMPREERVRVGKDRPDLKEAYLKVSGGVP